MKTRTLATLATAAALVSAASINAQELAYSVNYGVESEYVFRGVEITGDCFQGAFEVTYGDAYASVWASEAIDSVGSDKSEFDFNGGWSYALNDQTTLDMGGTLYHYPDADGDDTFEAYVGASFDVALAPSIYAFYDFDLDAFTLEGAIGHSIKVNETSSVELGATLGYVDYDNGFEYTYYGATADYVYALSENSDFSIGLRYSSNDKDIGPALDGNLWGGLSITTRF